MTAIALSCHATVYFRNPGNLTGWNNISTDTNCYLYSMSSPAYNGSGGSIEAECNYQGSGVRYHAEPTTYGNWNTNTTYFGYALYLPSDWDFSGTQRNVTEQYGTESNNLVITPDYYQAWLGGGTANVYQFSAINGSDENSGTMTAGTWHTIVTEITYGSGGNVTVWFDGNEAWSQNGNINGGGGGSPKGLWAVGLYEADWDGGNEGPQNPRIVYNAAITIASDYNDANPANYFPVSGAPVWDGGSGTDSDWSDTNNWSGIAIAAGDSLSFGGSSRLVNTNDTAAGTSYDSITFQPGAGAFDLNGNYISLAGNIINESSMVQTDNVAMDVAENPVLNAGTGGMVLGGGITNTSATWYTIHLQGTNGTLTGPVQSSSSELQENMEISLDYVAGASNTWKLAGNNASYLTNLTVAGGGLTLGNGVDTPFLAITNNTGDAFYVGTTTNTAAAFTLNSGMLNISYAGGAVVEIGESGSTGILNVNGGVLNVSGKYIQTGDSGGVGIINQSGGMVNASATGDVIFGNQTNSSGVLNISGGMFNIPANAFVGFRGPGVWNISGSGIVDVSANLNMVRNNTDSLYASGTINLNGGTLIINGESMGVQTGQTGAINFNGGVLEAGANSTSFMSPATPPATFTTTVKAGGAIINDNGFAISNASPLVHESTLGAIPDGGLTKQGAGTLTLSAVNTYTGDTTINAGTLALTGNGSIADSPDIIVAGGATFNVSASPSFALGSGQTFSNRTSTATINGNVTTGSGTLSLTYAPETPSLSVINGAMNLVSTTGIKVNNTGAALGAGAYTLISAGGGGLVTGALPSSVVVSGGGIVAGATASLQTNNGALDLIVTIMPLVPASIARFSLVQGNVVIGATNGVNDGTYYLLSSTNLALPLSEWTPVATNVVSISGGDNGFTFTATNGVLSNDAEQFYILSNTNK